MEMDKNNSKFKVGDRISNGIYHVRILGRTAERIKMEVTHVESGKVEVVSKKPHEGTIDIWGKNYPMEYVTLGKNREIYSVFAN